MVIWHVLDGRRRIFSSRRPGLPFFYFRLDPMIGLAPGRESLGSSWLQITIGPNTGS